MTITINSGKDVSSADPALPGRAIGTDWRAWSAIVLVPVAVALLAVQSPWQSLMARADRTTLLSDWGLRAALSVGLPAEHIVLAPTATKTRNWLECSGYVQFQVAPDLRAWVHIADPKAIPSRWPAAELGKPLRLGSLVVDLVDCWPHLPGPLQASLPRAVLPPRPAATLTEAGLSPIPPAVLLPDGQIGIFPTSTRWSRRLGCAGYLWTALNLELSGWVYDGAAQDSLRPKSVPPDECNADWPAGADDVRRAEFLRNAEEAWRRGR